jgi:putative ABC transport system permease protein
VVRTHAAFDQSSGVNLTRAPISAKVINQVRGVDGVRAAEGSVSGYALLTDTHGRAILPKSGAPTQGYSLDADQGLRGDVNIRSGHAPTGPGQVAIDASSAEDHHVPLGSTIKVLFRGPTREFTVVGTIEYGDSKNLGGTTGAYFDAATAQRVLGTPGTYNAIDVAAQPGVTPAQLASRINAVLPNGAEAVTGSHVAKESADAVNKNLGFVSVLFSAFAAIALFVGSFIIWNTFTMIVTQRSREIALLRAVGATRRQVMVNLLVEALLLGAAASAIGIGLGVLLARGLTALMSAVGLGLPTTTEQIAARTIIVSLIVGVLVTVVAAFVPARRATKVLPIEALREATPGSGLPSRRRTWIGVGVTVVGVAALLFGLYGGADGKLVLVGVGAILVGVLMTLPLVVHPLAAAIGRPLRLRGISGDLALQNATRNPRRTSSTAAALMIGLTLVVGMGVFASSLKASFGGILDNSTKAQLFLTSASSQADGFSPEAATVVAHVPGVKTVSAISVGQARFNGDNQFFSSIDPATASQALDLKVSAGSIRAMGSDGVLIKRKVATAKGLKLGDTIPVEFAATGTHNLRVAGIFDRNGSFIDSNYVLSLATQDAFDVQRLDSTGLILLDRGADQQQVQQRITTALANHPDARVLDQKGFEKASTGFIDTLVTFLTIMLLLSVLIALLGIVNTLALSVHERTRELGLLRAVGMTRSQVRSMIRWESVVISLIGAITGAGLGVGLGLALSQALKDQGITAVSVPILPVLGYIALAAVAGVLAAMGPSRGAAKVDLLKAVVTE